MIIATIAVNPSTDEDESGISFAKIIASTAITITGINILLPSLSDPSTSTLWSLITAPFTIIPFIREIIPIITTNIPEIIDGINLPKANNTPRIIQNITVVIFFSLSSDLATLYAV